MPNAITVFKKYINLLDDVYKGAAKSSVLDGDSSLVSQGANAGEIVIPKMSMDSLADYSRTGGYVKGAVTLTNETVALGFDRGRSFLVDAMDNEETAGVAFGKLSSEFIRTAVVPELDAYRFASYAGTASILAATPATLSDGAAALTALIVAATAMDNEEVPDEGRYLFITPTLYEQVMNVATTVSKAVLDSFAGIIKVPQTRFYTGITQYDGTTGGEEAGGYIKTVSTGKDINFMIVNKATAIQFQKNVVNQVMAPGTHTEGDGWYFAFRSYGVADAYENKVKGIYLHNKA